MNSTAARTSSSESLLQPALPNRLHHGVSTWNGLHPIFLFSPNLLSATGSASQEDFMEYDTCIVVDSDDNIVGSGSKKDCHVFTDHQPGILHRAFSVFLFDEEKRLLLQKRAAHKFTFPGYWTNTCCSHPLHGFVPPEVDTPEAIRDGSVTGSLFISLFRPKCDAGIKRAAIRKLEHELGIPSHQLRIEDFKYLTRLHYCASDVRRPGQDWSWGEHEMDYILLVQKSVPLQVNPEEASDHRYVDLDELRVMMTADSGHKWTPWFRLIFEHFLIPWWQDLPTALSTDRYVDLETIHRL